MKYAIVSSKGVTTLVLVEANNRLMVYTGNNEEDKNEVEFYERMGISTVDEALASGYSYSDIEIGEYTGTEKTRVQKIIDELPDPLDGD